MVTRRSGASPIAGNRVAADSGPLCGRVLVVDDNRVHRMIASIMMKGWGIEVVQAIDGLEAFHLITQSARADMPDVVLMDLRMPVMDGYDATRRIRAWEAQISRTARLPIIALTADAFDEDRRRCMDVGMNGFISKPINKIALRTALADWLVPAVSPRWHQIQTTEQ